MDDNYIALYVAIIKGLTPEQSLALVTKTRWRYSAEDTQDMIKLKAMGYTYAQIGSMYGISASAAYNRIARSRSVKEGDSPMKHGENPTRKQKKLLSERALNPNNWLIVKALPDKLVILHRTRGTVMEIPTGGV